MSETVFQITLDMNTTYWWNEHAEEVEKDSQDGSWWTGWARVELPCGTVLSCYAEGAMEGADLGPIEVVHSVEIE